MDEVGWERREGGGTQVGMGADGAGGGGAGGSSAVQRPSDTRGQPHHTAPLDLTVFLPDVLTFTLYGWMEQLLVLLYEETSTSQGHSTGP